MPNSPINSIIAAVAAAIRLLSSPTKESGWEPYSSSSTRLKPGAAKQLTKLVQKHRLSLMRLEKMAKLDNPGKLTAAQEDYLGSYSARVCAVVRVLARRRRYASASEIEAMANALDVWEPLPEKVRVFLEPKSKGGWRSIVIQGPMRTAQQLILRDLLVALGIDSEFDFTRKHAGGERGYIEMICDHIAEGYNWWAIADVKQCFPSLKPGHFKWLPISDHLTRNVLFLPKCAQIEMACPTGGTIKTSPGDKSYDVANEYDPLIEAIRQGLSQGAVTSPLLARSLLGRTLWEALGDRDVVGGSFSDDLAIGACSQTDATAAFDALTKRLKSLPAGPPELHTTGVVNAPLKGLNTLGYKLTPGNGCGDNPVHVKPGKPRIKRFKSRLRKKLQDALPGDDLWTITQDYWSHWYGSQAAWTKVPQHSALLSENIALSYLDDFLHGVPMGENATPKPGIKLLPHF